VNQMQADEQLRLPARQHTHRVSVPDFLKESFRHCDSDSGPIGPRYQ
jgi:hypothetical protein